MIGLPYGEKKLWRYVKPFPSDTGTLRTDGRTDRRTDGRTDRTAISISRVSVLTRDKNACTGCVSTDVGTWMNWLTFEPDPNHSLDAGTGFLSRISYNTLLRGILHRYLIIDFIVLIFVFAYQVAYTQWRFATCFHYATPGWTGRRHHVVYLTARPFVRH